MFNLWYSDTTLLIYGLLRTDKSANVRFFGFRKVLDSKQLKVRGPNEYNFFLILNSVLFFKSCAACGMCQFFFLSVFCLISYFFSVFLKKFQLGSCIKTGNFFTLLLGVWRRSVVPIEIELSNYLLSPIKLTYLLSKHSVWVRLRFPAQVNIVFPYRSC